MVWWYGATRKPKFSRNLSKVATKQRSTFHVSVLNSLQRFVAKWGWKQKYLIILARVSNRIFIKLTRPVKIYLGLTDDVIVEPFYNLGTRNFVFINTQVYNLNHLTNREASPVLCSVVKHAAKKRLEHERSVGRNTRRSRVFLPTSLRVYKHANSR